MKKNLMKKNHGLIFVLLISSASLVSAQVSEEWVARYNGPRNSRDEANAMALDAFGNVYVTGRSCVRPRGGSCIDYDYATVKYDSAGNQLWVARYNGPVNHWDVATAIAVDADGNAYVTGVSTGVGPSGDYATVKYDSAGNQLWVARYNGPGNAYDGARAMAVDAGGNVYVTGESAGVGTLYDYATVKYDSDGNELWVARYNGPGNAYDGARAMAVDADGNAYVTGASTGVGTSGDYATVKYDSAGNQLWVACYNGPGNRYDGATAIALDADGNVYVTGPSAGVDTGPDYATVKYDFDGNQLWVARYNGPGNAWDAATAIALDADGNVYVTGLSEGVGTREDYATVKYDFDGNQLWVARYNGPGNGSDDAFAMALDANGNVYVTGYSYGGVDTASDYTTVKYDADGNELWVARYNGPGNGYDRANAMALDANGNVYVTGWSCGAGPFPGCLDYATVKYVPQPPPGSATQK